MSDIGGGVAAYDLADWFCGSCRRPKSFRLWPGTLTGCPECDKAVTAHRCTGRPDMADLESAGSWECPECGTAWAVVLEEDTCGECGRSGLLPAWSVTPGPRLATAPRYEPHPYTPFRNLLSRPVSALQPMGSCYRHRAGFMVHVEPGCRC